MADVEELARAARNLKHIPDPQEVVVVRPKATAAGFFGRLIAALVMLAIRAAIVSWSATKVDVVPDFGFVEALFLCLFATYLLSSGLQNTWSRGWPERARAAYDRANAALKRAMKSAVDKAADR